MCGLFCYIGRSAFRQEATLSALHHRGPDSRGLKVITVSGDRTVTLLHTRLAILDLSTRAAQPLTTADGQFTIIFNGEIYNYRRLREQLEGEDPGIRFTSTSDTEVVLAGFQRWGEDVFARLDGMFSAVIFDERSRCVSVARDHLGIKPLYWARTADGGLCFSSEIRALLASGLIARVADTDAISAFLALGSMQAPDTILKGVREFPTASCARVDTGAVSLACLPHKYWSLAVTPAEAPRRDALALTRLHDERLAEAVSLQSVCDVKAGLFLSDGIDSSVLAQCLASHPTGNLTSFTLSYHLDSADETMVAAQTAALLGIHHESVSLDRETLGSWVEDGLAAMDQPSADGLNMYLVSRASRSRGIVVALCGTGADELHGGYAHLHQLQRLLYFSHRLNERARTELGAIICECGGRWKSQLLERVGGLVSSVGSASTALAERRRYLTPAQITALGWRSPKPLDTALPAQFDGSVGSNEEIASSLLRGEFTGYLANTLLRDADWASMANSQEVRVPFLGRAYLEATLAVPYKMRLGRMPNSKPLLRQLLGPSLRHLALRRKSGFNIDYRALLAGPARHIWLQSVPTLRDVGLTNLDPLIWFNAAQNDISGRLARRMWSLLALGFYLGTNSLSVDRS